MRFTRFAMLALVSAAFGVACSSSSGPSDTDPPDGNCVSDFSCEIDQECNGSACGAIKPALHSHIQLASCQLRAPLDAGEASWRASHYDLLIAGFYADETRAVNPNVRLFEYVIARYNRFDRPGQPTTASAWASSHGYNGEDFYLHYKEDVNVPTWEGRDIVPNHPEYPDGVAPGWNPGGGGNPATATERSHSRAVGYYSGGEAWYLANVTHPGYRAFLKYHIAGLIDGTWWYNQTFATGPLDGVMVDESIWYPVFGEGLLDRSTEYYGIPVNDSHPYTYAIENMYPAIASDMLDEFSATKDIMPNYGHVLFLNFANRCAQQIQDTTPWIYGEVWLNYTGFNSPTSGTNRCITYDKDYVNAIREIANQTRNGGRRIIGARDYANGVWGTDRGKLFTLGLYYLLHNKRTYYMYETVTNHAGIAHVSSWGWNPAVETDIGQPDQIPAGKVDYMGNANTKEHYVYETGADPVNGSLTYRVLARHFTNALVLVKMLPEGSTVDNSSITHHVLDGPYTPLLADGSVGPVVTEVDLRNNEALILLK
jgi:hypothetical protein